MERRSSRSVLTILNSIQNKFHHLAQFLAAFGNSYLPKARDDSQSALYWSVKQHTLSSGSVNGISLLLEFKTLSLHAVKEATVKTLHIIALSHGEIDAWIRAALTEFGLDASLYNHDLGFRLETDFEPFTKADSKEKKIISTLIWNRDIAERNLAKLKKKYENHTPSRVWPHHFDTGMLIDTSTKKDMSKGIGIGYSISDIVSLVPYFYVYAWSNEKINYKQLPNLKQGMWIIEDWKGAIFTIHMKYNSTLVGYFYRDVVTILSKRIA